LSYTPRDSNKIIGYCQVCGSPVSKVTIRKVSTAGGKKEIWCENCFRKHFIEPRVNLRIYKYTGLFKRR